MKAIAVMPVDYMNFEGTYEVEDIAFIVNVYDAKDNPVSGATVTWIGCGFYGTSISDEDGDGGGDAHIGGGTVSLPVGKQEGTINFKASKSGYGDFNIDLAVVRGDPAVPQYLYS